MTVSQRYFATCPRGLEGVLAAELRELGADPEETRVGVRFAGPLAIAYRACLWSRVANRVLLELARFAAGDAEELYAGARTVHWADHLGATGSLAVDAVGTNVKLAHSGFTALRVKDAIVDQLRRQDGARPTIDPARPDLRVHLYLHGEEATLFVDLSGESLHRRHYRGDGGPAPLKENLAAGLLLLAGWPGLARQGRPFCDPMCGSGTLLVEAALIAADIAPGLQRSFGFERWRGHDVDAWRLLVQEAAARAATGRGAYRSPIAGFDADDAAVGRARANARRATVDGLVRIEHRALGQLAEVEPGEAGLLVTNPPYGARLGDELGLIPLYTALGDLLKRRFTGWSAHVLAGSAELARYLGLRAARRVKLYNGPIECRLLHYPIVAGPARRRKERPAPAGAAAVVPVEDTEPACGADAFANRLRKNEKRVGRWARRQGIGCYRVYDADLPEYAVAVDRYEGWVHVQEYAAPASIDAQAARRRLRQILSLVPTVLGVAPEDVFLKVRRRQRGAAQYGKLTSTGELREVHEDDCRFLINLRDYLDTGLFLDARSLRALIGELAAGRRFLNLFAYTGTATVCAARGGALSTVSVDLSATYLAWARRNLDLNGVAGPQHELVRADCREWIKHEAERLKGGRGRPRYGLIFLDPPTFSTSKAMVGTLDIQRDHVWLLRATSRLLAPDGVLLFSTNHQRFALDAAALPELQIEELRLLPPDFARTPRIRRGYRVTLRG